MMLAKSYALCLCGTVIRSRNRRCLACSTEARRSGPRYVRQGTCLTCGSTTSAREVTRCRPCGETVNRDRGIAAFWDRVDRSAGPAGCWPWLGWVDPKTGYGKASAGRDRHAGAHRRAYELVVGPIPEGLELDHLCHEPVRCAGGLTCPHRRCVNPTHLEAVDHLTNVRRSLVVA